jgi:adenine/guanine phosphoribosyltransferase-like PRPP-binding protein
MGWDPAKTGLVPALSSSDTSTTPTKPIPKVTKLCAQFLGAVYLPSVLTKNPHPALSSQKTSLERTQALNLARYKATATGLAGLEQVLIVDDFVTRGETLTAIATAIHAVNPSVKVYGIALGKTEKRRYAQDAGKVISNDAVPQRWVEIWDTYS